MSDFFDSLKTDLLDRRLMPVLALLGVALLGAIAYAAMAGGSGSSKPAASSPVPAQKAPGIPVTAATSAKTAVAETTSGAVQQTAGHSRNPFAPLPGVKAANTSGSTAAASESASGSSTAGSSGAEGSQGSSGGGTESSPSESSPSQSGGAQPKQKGTKKPSKTYKVSVLFGTAPVGTPALTAGLPSYEDLQRRQPLPSAKQPLIVYRGVIAGGESATFTLVGEAILRGNAACKPSAAQCQAIDVKAGETEELEYVPLEGTPVNYELHVLKIEAVKAKAAGAASTASAKAAFAGESKAGLRILREAGLLELPGLRWSTDGSVLVFEHANHAPPARARVSAWGAALRG